MTELLCVCGVPITPCQVGYTHNPHGWMGNCNYARPADGSIAARYTYDPDAHALYLSLTPDAEGIIVSTVTMPSTVNADLDAAGNVIGVEILNPWPRGSTPASLPPAPAVPEETL